MEFQLLQTILVSGNFDQNNIPLTIGAADFGGAPANFFDGKIDEVHVMNKAQSNDWITTEYNNQSNPGTFYTVSGPADHSVYDFGSFCQNSTKNYSVPNHGAFSYTWSVTGGSVQSGQGTSAASILWTTGTGSGEIKLSVFDGAQTGTSIDYNVLVNPVPGTSITPDPAQTCPGADLALNGNPSGGSGTYSSHSWTGAGSGFLSASNIVNPVFNKSTFGNSNLIYTVTDDKGCTGSDNISVNVSDATAPIFTQPVDISISCDASILPATTGNVTAADMADNCAPDANLTVSYTDVSTQNADASLLAHYNYTITRTWEVKDVAGNATQHDQKITVTDATAPIFTQPVDISISCDASILPATTGNVTAADMADNCAPDANLTVSYTDVSTQNADASLLAHYNYTITRTWEVKDVAGNATQHDQKITVTDATAPIFTQPVDISISCDASILPATTGNVTAADMADNCAPDANLTVSYTDVSTQNADASLLAHYNYTITRTWEVKDVAGNATQHDQKITVTDATAPIFTVPQNDTICRNLDCTYNALTAVTGEITAADMADNCAPDANLTLTYSDDFNNLTSCDTIGYIIRNWVLTDVSGNKSKKSQIIWVEPTSRIIVTPKQDTICNGAQVSITLASTSVPTRSVKFRYVTEAPAGVTVTPATGGPLDNNAVLVNSITNANDQAQLVKFIITPYTRQAGSELEKCTGINDTAYVWVEPTARIMVTPKQDTICNGDQVNITLTSTSVPTRAVKFRYVTEAPAGVTVAPANGTGLNNSDILTNTITNTNDQAQLVRFIITPYSRQAGSENEKCTGINDTAYVWVEPTARITVTPKQDTICNGAQVSITLTSPSVPTRAVKFRYVTEAPAGVTVTPATGGPLDNNAVLVNSITNTNDQAQLVRFIVTPYTRQAGSELEKCTGINDTAYVWVEPTARITVTPKQDTICNGAQVSITLTSPSVPTRAVKFRYVTEAPAGVTVTPATGGPLDNNAVLVNSITNTNDQAQLVKFIVTPYTRQAGSENEKCTGINDTAYVWVEPTARITVTPKQDTICNGAQVNITLTSPSVPTRAVKFRYVTEAPAGVTVTPATGGPLDNNAVLVNSITNTNDQAQLVKFIVTPYTRHAGSELEKCTGINDTAYVWVEPTARITVTPKVGYDL